MDFVPRVVSQRGEEAAVIGETVSLCPNNIEQVAVVLIQRANRLACVSDLRKAFTHQFFLT